MKDTPLNTLPKESVDAIVRSTERIEIAAVRCVLESCAAELDGAWAEA